MPGTCNKPECADLGVRVFILEIPRIIAKIVELYFSSVATLSRLVIKRGC